MSAHGERWSRTGVGAAFSWLHTSRDRGRSWPAGRTRGGRPELVVELRSGVRPSPLARPPDRGSLLEAAGGRRWPDRSLPQRAPAGARRRVGEPADAAPTRTARRPRPWPAGHVSQEPGRRAVRSPGAVVAALLLSQRPDADIRRLTGALHRLGKGSLTRFSCWWISIDGA